MSPVIPGPSSNDPFGQHREVVVSKLIDSVLEELNVNDCIELALKKARELEGSRELSLTMTKLEEGQHWLWAHERQSRLPRRAPAPTVTVERGAP
jgi:hypothetical protein